MHFFKTSFNYDHPWTHVQLGIWHKYPNPHCTHVLTVDVLDRSIDLNTGIVRTERILGCKQKAPIWIVKLLGGSEDAFIREVTFVDPVSQRTSIVSRNMSLSQYVTCLERIQYIPEPSHPEEKTLFTQTAEIQTRAAIWRSLANKLEEWSCERFGDNARLGRMGLESVLRNLWESKGMHVEH
ncbi:MSF1-domain-containing protein [Ramaria rubella]|nr:MSF1-domain-containing protein [Ramaria rubella]